MTFETYIGGEKIEEITPEIRKYITDQFIKAFGSRVVDCTERRNDNGKNSERI